MALVGGHVGWPDGLGKTRWRLEEARSGRPAGHPLLGSNRGGPRRGHARSLLSSERTRRALDPDRAVGQFGIWTRIRRGLWVGGIPELASVGSRSVLVAGCGRRDCATRCVRDVSGSGCRAPAEPSLGPRGGCGASSRAHFPERILFLDVHVSVLCCCRTALRRLFPSQTRSARNPLLHRRRRGCWRRRFASTLSAGCHFHLLRQSPCSAWGP